MHSDATPQPYALCVHYGVLPEKSRTRVHLTLEGTWPMDFSRRRVRPARPYRSASQAIHLIDL
jgi:hypothetical protein